MFNYYMVNQEYNLDIIKKDFLTLHFNQQINFIKNHLTFIESLIESLFILYKNDLKKKSLVNKFKNFNISKQLSPIDYD